MSIPRLIEAAQALATGDPGRDYLEGAIASLGAGETAAEAFGLVNGQLLEQRNQYLREAAELLAPDKSHWHQAGELKRALSYFDGTTWKRYRNDPAAGLATLTGVKRILFAARLCGDCPKTQERLYKVIVD